jgi:hypothetical protein
MQETPCDDQTKGQVMQDAGDDLLTTQLTLIWTYVPDRNQ